MVSTLTEALDQRHAAVSTAKREKRSANIDAYRALVAAAADGDEFDPTEAIELLDSLDLPANQIDDDIDTVRQRRILRQHLDQRDAATERLRSVHAELSDKQAELQRIVREHREAIAPLQAEEATLQSALSAAQNAECRLRNERPWWFADADAHMADWRQAIGERRRRLNGRIADEERNLAKHERLVGNKNSPQNPFHVTDENRELSKKAVKHHRKLITQFQKQLTEIDKEAEKIEAAAAELDKEKLQP